MFAKRFAVLTALVCLQRICLAGTIYIPDDYPTIQEGVDAAVAGDTVFIHAGTYYESVQLNKSIALVGEDKWAVSINAPSSGSAIELSANSCTISELSLAGGTSGTHDSGVYIESDSNTIEHCRFAWGHGSGITLKGNHNTIANSFFGDNHWYGIWYGSSVWVGNEIYDNTIASNLDGIAFYKYLECESGNLVYHNNFVDNHRLNARDQCPSTWYNPGLEEGNYWSDFDEAGEGAYDDDSNGIVDTPYDVPDGPDQDLYPLMKPRPGPLFVDAYGPYSGHVGVPLEFAGSVQVGTPPYTWEWDFGDGSYSSDQNPVHIYETIELNTVVTVTVTDSLGYMGSDKTTVYVILPSNSVTYVDDDYTEDTLGWGLDHFDNIQQAIDMTEDSGTVYVRNGTYFGQVVVDKSFSLIGEDNTSAILSGLDQYTISVSASPVTIQGFKFVDTQYGILNSVPVSDLTIIGNRFTDGVRRGVHFGGDCTGSTVTGNIFQYCQDKALFMFLSNDNTISENTFANNEIGVSLLGSEGNTFFHNCFIENYWLDADDPYGMNIWDNGYPSGGNYWSSFDHSSEGAYDDYSGENQDIPGADGIADSAYTVYPGHSMDRYPLMTMPCELEGGQCGDANYSASTDIDDIVHVVNYIFIAGPPPFPYSSGDVDCSGVVDIDDVVYLVGYIFSGGPAPCDPDGDGVPDC